MVCCAAATALDKLSTVFEFHIAVFAKVVGDDAAMVVAVGLEPTTSRM